MDFITAVKKGNIAIMYVPSLVFIWYLLRLTPGVAFSDLISVNILLCVINVVLLFVGTIAAQVFHEILHFVYFPNKAELRLVENEKGGLYFVGKGSDNKDFLAKKPYAVLMPVYANLLIGIILLVPFIIFRSPFFLSFAFGSLVLSYRSMSLNRTFTDNELFLRRTSATKSYAKWTNLSVIFSTIVLTVASTVVMSFVFLLFVLLLFNNYAYPIINRFSFFTIKICLNGVATRG
jgi:hypothetical protein